MDPNDPNRPAPTNDPHAANDPHVSSDPNAADAFATVAHRSGGGTVRATVRPLVPAGLPAAGGTVPVLLRLEAHLDADTRPPRTPLDLALVLDRSGSMQGAPLAAAKRGAADAIDILEDGDRVALLAFGSDVQPVAPLTELGTDRSALHAAVDAIHIEGRTALHDGWTAGAQAIADQLHPDRRARVLLLSDGRANVGITDADTFAGDVTRLHDAGIDTSTLGVGGHFDEDLLTTLAQAGGGRFGWADGPNDVRDAIVAEVVGTDATVARDLRVRTVDGGPRVRLAALQGAYAVDGDATVLPDLVDGLPLDLLAHVEVGAGDPAADVDAGTLVLTWTDPTGAAATAGLELRVDLLDAAAYDGAPRDPEVVGADVASRVADHRRRALDAARRRDRDAAQAAFDEVQALLEGAPDVPAIRRQRAAFGRTERFLKQADLARMRKALHVEEERRRSGFDRERFLAGDAYDGKAAALARRRAERAAHADRTAPSPAAADRAGPDDPTQRTPERTLRLPRADGGTGEVRLVLGDLTGAGVDAIVNPTNPAMQGSGRTVDGAVHRRGGRGLTRACLALGHLPVGEATVTRGYDLPAAYVLHVATAPFEGTRGDLARLESGWRNAYALATQMHLRHLAVPAIGLGTNGYPPDAAATSAVTMATDAVQADGAPDRIDVVAYDVAALDALRAAFDAQGAVAAPAGAPA